MTLDIVPGTLAQVTRMASSVGKAERAVVLDPQNRVLIDGHIRAMRFDAITLLEEVVATLLLALQVQRHPSIEMVTTILKSELVVLSGSNLSDECWSQFALSTVEACRGAAAMARNKAVGPQMVLMD